MTAARLCVAFALTHPSVGTVLFWPSRMERLMDNGGVVDPKGP